MFAEYVENGINIIRLGFNWSALEPEKNCFDERAFGFLKKFVSTAQDNNIYVLGFVFLDSRTEHLPYSELNIVG